MRLRRIAGDSIGKARWSTGQLLQADTTFRSTISGKRSIKLAERRTAPRDLSMMSDRHRHSILQRNLYLESVLHDD